MSFCPKCGKELESGTQFCSGCGAAVGADAGKNKHPKIWLHVLIALLVFAAIGVTIKGIWLAGLTAKKYFFDTMPTPSAEELALMEKRDSLRRISEAVTRVGATTEDTPIDIIVKIAGTEDLFIKASIIFEYDEENKKLGVELRKNALTKYKDILTKYMSSLSFNEATDPSERDKICKDLKRMVNASLPPDMGEIRSVMFTRYITQ